MAARGRGGGKTPERVTELLQKAVEANSQVIVANATGLTRLTIQRYLKGIGEPSQATLEKLSIYFELPVMWLRGEDVQDEWGEVFGDNLTSEQIEDLKIYYRKTSVERAANSPLIQTVVKCLIKLPAHARPAAFAIIGNTCRYIDSLSEDELIKVGEDLLKRLHDGCECQQEESQKNKSDQSRS